jgi:hypothetical protein
MTGMENGDRPLRVERRRSEANAERNQTPHNNGLQSDAPQAARA